MASVDLIYYKVDSNVALLCGWTKDKATHNTNEGESNEFKSETPLEETKVIVEVNKEGKNIFFPQIVGDPAIISCHLLINFLNDAMTMLR